MKKLGIVLVILGLVMVCGVSANAGTTDVVQYSTGYFVPDEDHTYASPYYRWYNQDWGWTHGAISESSFTSATLSISAWDVDAWPGPGSPYDPSVYQWDIIYAYDADSLAWIELGSLLGNTDQYSYTTFDLYVHPELWDDMADGLQVKIDIDSTYTYSNWAVTLAKSVISVDGGTLPDPNPSVPEPSTFLLLGVGLMGAGLLRRKIKR